MHAFYREQLALLAALGWSLGNMVGYGREYLTRAPWIMLCPAFVIVVSTLSISIVGDWLRDRLDPTLQ